MNDDLIGWCEAARGFLAEHASTVLGQLNDDIARLERMRARDNKFYVCVLGQSAVGKSTLLNSMVAGDRTILPASGVGPLTALATEVHYAPLPSFSVRYRSRRQLDGFRLRFEAELRRSASAALAADDLHVAAQLVDNEIADEGAQDETSRNDLVRQLTQLVRGEQFSEALSTVELVASLRQVLGLKDDSGVSFDGDDAARIESARCALEAARANEEVTYDKARLGAEFDAILEQHAAGNLAPLVAAITVGYPAELLKDGLVLIDLPGVGVASDRYREITARYVKMSAGAVILVVDRAGPTESSVNLIRASGYWGRLLLSSADPQNDPCALIIAVTKVDDVASERYLKLKALPKAERPKLADLFADVKRQVAASMYIQAQKCFANIGDTPAKDEDLSEAMSEASRTLLNSLRIFPVSAPQYRFLLAEDEELRPFINDREESGVPALMAYIASMAATFRDQNQSVEAGIIGRIGRAAHGALDEIEASWTTKEHAREEAAKLRAELERFLQPFRNQLANKQGEFREYLQSTAAAQVGELVAKSQFEAQAAVTAYLRNLREVHWATLRATVRRGGAHVSYLNRRIDLAADIAQRFEEPLSGIWGRTLLKSIRARTKSHGELLAEYVNQICTWANERTDTTVQREILDRQQESMTDRAAQLAAVGREAVDELKVAIKRDLQSTIEKPVRKACQDFQKRGDDCGRGVKQRILDLFEDLARQAVNDAGEPACRLLKNRVDEVQMEIVKSLNQWGDPLEQVADAVVEREEQRLQRSDSQRRAAILAELSALRSALPPVREAVLQ